MISNLDSARALIQSDLDHARSVMALWSDQVTELEKALEQLNLVDTSRTTLRSASQGQSGSVPVPTSNNDANGKAKRGRKPKQVTPVQPEGKSKKPRIAKSAFPSSKSKASEGSGRAPGRSSRRATAQMDKKKAVSGAAKYQDPNSDKTWTGRGRRPGWMVGAPEKYAIDQQAGSQSGSTVSKNSGADTDPVADASAYGAKAMGS